MDALSEVLGAVRLTGAVFLEMELRAQWSYLTAPARKIADVLMPDADQSPKSLAPTADFRHRALGDTQILRLGIHR